MLRIRIPNYLIEALNSIQFKFHTWNSSFDFLSLTGACPAANVLLQCFRCNIETFVSQQGCEKTNFYFSVSLTHFASSVAKRSARSVNREVAIWFGVISVHNTPKRGKILVLNSRECELTLTRSVKIILSASRLKTWHKEVKEMNELKCRASDVIIIIINYSSDTKFIIA